MVKLEIPKELPVNKLNKIGVSKKTNEEHLKLWQGYAKNNNKAVEALDQRKNLKDVNSTFSDVRSQKMAEVHFLNQNLFS